MSNIREHQEKYEGVSLDHHFVHGPSDEFGPVPSALAVRNIAKAWVCGGPSNTPDEAVRIIFVRVVGT
jgi:hypothetical protein